MEDAAIINARYQGIAAAVAAIARGDRISLKIRGGVLSIPECETAYLLMQRLGVSLADLEASGAAAADLDTIRQVFARLDEFWRRKPVSVTGSPFAGADELIRKISSPDGSK